VVSDDTGGGVTSLSPAGGAVWEDELLSGCLGASPAMYSVTVVFQISTTVPLSVSLRATVPAT